jgi:hypothetical protein
MHGQSAPLPHLSKDSSSRLHAPLIAKGASEPLPNVRSEARREDSIAAFLLKRARVSNRLFSTDSSSLPNIIEDEAGDGLTPWQASLNLVKATIGAGSMGLPFAFRQGGPAPFSFGITLLMGAICAYTIVLIVKSERKLSSKATNGTDEDPFITKTSEQSPKATRALTFPEIGAAAFPNLSFTLCGARFNAVELLLHVIVQVIVLGVCVAYTDFIAQTLPSLWPDTFDAGLSILLVVPFFICTAMLRSFSVLAITSVIGDVAVMAAFIAVVAYGFASSDYGHLHIPMEPVGHEVVGFVQTATFLFAVHANMLPIAQAMKDPETQFELTLYKTFACIVLVNGVFAFLCYGTPAPQKHSIRTVIDATKNIIISRLVFVLVTLNPIPATSVRTPATKPNNSQVKNPLIKLY